MPALSLTRKTASPVVSNPCSHYADAVRFGYADFPPYRVPTPIAFSQTRTGWKKARYALFVEMRISRKTGDHFLLFILCALEPKTGIYDFADPVYRTADASDADDVWSSLNS